MIVGIIAFPLLRHFLQHADPLSSRGINWVRKILFVTIVGAAIYAVGFDFDTTVGLTGTVLIFSSLLIGLDSYARMIRHRYAIPVYALLVISAFYFSLAGLNSFKYKREISSAHSEEPVILNLGQYFEEWIARHPLTRKANPPVFIVSAQGGGLYAAYHSAIYLSRVQDKCSFFKNVIFALNGVSGGSLGVAAFRAASSAHATMQGGYCGDLVRSETNRNEQLVKTFLQNDFLTPIVKRTFFAEIPALLLAYPISVADRTRAFEQGIETAWQSAVARTFPDRELSASIDGFQVQSFFGQPFLYVAGGSRKMDGPALVFNTVEGRSNKRVIFAPFRFEGSNAHNFYDLPGGKVDVPLSAAVSASAAFPYISSQQYVRSKSLPETFVTNGDQRRRSANYPILFDGGFYDNSGSGTATELLDVIAGNQTSDSDVYVVSLYSPHEGRPVDLTGLKGPVNALFDAQARRQIPFFDALSSDSRVTHIVLELLADELQLPLNWTLPPDVFRRIEEAIANPSSCRIKEAGKSDYRVSNHKNGCVGEVVDIMMRYQ